MRFLLWILLFAVVSAGNVAAADRVFRAGAYGMDVTPVELPVIVNGGMTERTADKIHDRLHARCVVLDDGAGPMAIVVVDSCMMPRDLLTKRRSWRIPSPASNPSAF